MIRYSRSPRNQLTGKTIQVTPIKPITPEAKTLLEEFLSRPSHPEGTLSLGEVRGFLYAVTAAPDLVKPSEWLPMIFGGEEPWPDRGRSPHWPQRTLSVR